MRHPFQCILYGRDPTDLASEGFIVAACGSRLVSLSLTSNEIISEWNSGPDETNQTNDKTIQDDNKNGERPTKKQKTANGPSSKPSKAPNILKLVASPDFQHIVAVTDDKCIRVFQCQEARLEELSSRCMPKRPCAIQVLPDNLTILAGDKFGDVYSLPLIPATMDDVQAEVQQITPQPEKAFKVSASTLTVHSKRNRDALKAQLEQKNFTAKKEPLKFEHKLLLGHVSMLTDLKVCSRHVDGARRDYIITADRDEHIRISRGPPQAHIIEGFCLGHKEYVSQICRIGDTDLLVSGGGDHWLGVWNWTEYKLRRRFDLRKLLSATPDPAVLDKDFKINVSGIWCAEVAAGDGSEQVIVVACEKVKAMFFIGRSLLEASEDAVDTLPTVFALDNYPLDVTLKGSTVLVSTDARNEANGERLYALNLSKEISGDHTDPVVCKKSSMPGDAEALRNLNNLSGSETNSTDEELDELLYGIANLRKRGHQGGGEEDGEEGAAEED